MTSESGHYSDAAASVTEEMSDGLTAPCVAPAPESGVCADFSVPNTDIWADKLCPGMIVEQCAELHADPCPLSNLQAFHPCGSSDDEDGPADAHHQPTAEPEGIGRRLRARHTLVAAPSRHSTPAQNQHHQ